MRTSGLRTRPLGLFSKGDAVMPTRITTRAARVALRTAITNKPEPRLKPR